jgi:hypothetical protein
MTLPTQLDGLPEVSGVLTVDPNGRLLSAVPGTPHADPAGSNALAAALRGFAQAGDAAGLGAFVVAHLKGARTSMVGGQRPDALLLVHVDPSRMSGPVEKAVRAWTRGEDAPRPPPLRRATPPAPTAAVAEARTPPPAPAAARATLPPRPPATSPGVPAADAPAPRARHGEGVRDPWALLRRALGRSQLTEAATLRWELPAAGDPARAGCEPVEREACEAAIQALLEGVGSVMAGDGIGGARVLAALARDDQPNLTFRWLALHWSARAAVRSGAIPTARARVQAALTISRQLDIEARALSQWIAAEVLAHDNDSARALTWLSEARSRFERIEDRWGLGQTWLTEARTLSALERAAPAVEAARHAAELLPDSDEPPALLARLAILRDDLEGAQTLVQGVRTQAADKVRALVGAIREGLVSREDALEYLREHDAAPSQRSLRALTRVASSSPRFLQAREALAWMMLRTGRYAEAGTMFRALLSQPLSAADRASVMLGLGCVANAGKAATPAQAVLEAGLVPAAAAEVPLPAPASTSMVGPARGNGPADAVFSGQLSSFALPDLLEFLRSGRRTGLLVCSCTSGIGALRFRDGKIVGAASPGTPNLAEALARAGGLAADRVHEVTAGADLPDDMLADRLVEGGLADAGAVQEALSRQVWVAIRELVGWRDGEFAFNRDDGAASPSRLSVEVDPQEVLLDVFKEMDEASRGASPTPAGSSR